MPPPAPPFAIRRATPADYSFVAALNERSYREVVLRQFGAWDRDFQNDKFEQKWRRGPYRIVVEGGRPVGAFLLEEHPDHLFLADIQIDGPAQGRGLGTHIVNAAIGSAAARRLPLRLRVLHRNRARALYERLGFRQYGITETHYLMEKPAGAA